MILTYFFGRIHLQLCNSGLKKHDKLSPNWLTSGVNTSSKRRFLISAKSLGCRQKSKTKLKFKVFSKHGQIKFLNETSTPLQNGNFVTIWNEHPFAYVFKLNLRNPLLGILPQSYWLVYDSHCSSSLLWHFWSCCLTLGRLPWLYQASIYRE